MSFKNYDHLNNFRARVNACEIVIHIIRGTLERWSLSFQPHWKIILNKIAILLTDTEKLVLSKISANNVLNIN